MSQYKRIETQIKDGFCLRQAIQDVGLTFEESVDLRGWGFRRGGRADIVIRAQTLHSWNDLGFVQQPSGMYIAIADDHPNTEKALNQIRQRYAYRAVVQQARRRGYNVIEQNADDGTIRLQLVRR